MHIFPSGNRILIYLLIISIVLVFAQLSLGGIVRVTGSGDGCPDWPKCFGNWLPPWSDLNAIIEWSHRTLGAFLGMVIFSTSILVWSKYRDNRQLVYFSTLTSLLVIVIGGIGGLVVLTNLDPALRTIHLMGAEFIAALTVLSFVQSTNGNSERNYSIISKENARVFTYCLIALSFILLSILTGAYAVWKGAGSICPSWPLCGGVFIPNTELTLIHSIHRITSIMSSFIILLIFLKTLKISGISFGLRTSINIIVLLMLAQVLVGATNPWSGFQPWARATHLSLATLLWMNMVLIVALLRFGIPNYRNQ